MTAQRVGIRKFRADLAAFIDADVPVAVTRHGRTVGYFIPTPTDREADAAALRAAAASLDALLHLDEQEIGEIVTKFGEARSTATTEA